MPQTMHTAQGSTAQPNLFIFSFFARRSAALLPQIASGPASRRPAFWLPICFFHQAVCQYRMAILPLPTAQILKSGGANLFLSFSPVFPTLE